MTSLYPADTVSGVVISYVPLTTVFTPPSSCSSIFRQDGPSYVAFDPGYGLDVDQGVICQPPAVTTWWEQANLGDVASGHTAVSLGPLTCPDNWKTMESSVKDDLSTVAICCPSGYYLDGGQEGQVTGNCLSDISSGYKGTWAYTDDSSDWTVTTSTLTASSSTVGAIAVVGWNIKQSASSTSNPTSSGGSSSSTPTTLATTTGYFMTSTTTPELPTSSYPTSGGLSTGASIGIGVGVALGVIGIVSLILAVCLLRRRRQRKAESEGGQAPLVEHRMTDFKRDGPGPWRVQELGADGERQRSELPSEEALSPPVELSG